MRRNSRRSQRLILVLRFIPQAADEWLVMGVTPDCDDGCPREEGELCDSCWLQDFVTTCGFASIIEVLEHYLPGGPAETYVSGFMVGETKSTEHERNYSEKFEISSIDVRPLEE